MRLRQADENRLRKPRMVYYGASGYEGEGKIAMRVALFITCFNDTLFPETGRATVEVLERLGVEVDFPLAQTCCGQMHFNTGYQREAIPLVPGVSPRGSRISAQGFSSSPISWPRDSASPTSGPITRTGFLIIRHAT